MMHQNGPSNAQKYRNNSPGGFAPRSNKPPVSTFRSNINNNNGGHPKPGGNNNNNHNNNQNGNNINTNTAPRTGSNAVPVTPKDKSTATCYECGVVGHYSNECPKKLAKTTPIPLHLPSNSVVSQLAGTRTTATVVSTNLLDPSLLHIAHSVAGILPESAAAVARRRRSSRPPPPLPRPSFDSPSSPTSSYVNADPRRPPVSPPTP
ncbi:hypothetical protein QYE76_068055 [Lolium multiflorum]|uniref:CCHC-type domain-containing protein n=1 Tax=Lolium multiflorum TaxID=4521 RepID=A0AAD8SG10_LOLMU|nr:hypothetical protein QYE76_068055 [Lolium multiflorum]